MSGNLQSDGRLTRSREFGRKAGSLFQPANSQRLFPAFFFFFLSIFLFEPTLTCCFLSPWVSFSRKDWPWDARLGFCFLVWCAARSQVEECEQDSYEWGGRE